MDRSLIKNLTLSELEEAIIDAGMPKWRSSQIYRWFSKGAGSFAEMTDLSAGIRSWLEEKYVFTAPTVLTRQDSSDGTVKILWGLRDGASIESVIMRYEYGNTICISSQVGCRQGCAFCASTIGGKVRDLEPCEMLDQVIFAQKETGRTISHIVLMGIGEPLDNFENVVRFLSLVNDKNGLNIGMRHISLSTCGIIDGIRKLAELNLQLTLSVSLHAPDDETRSKIMPVNRRYPVDDLLNECRAYFEKTGRRISFEYAMIRGVNDTEKHAKILTEKLAGFSTHVNLIPLNHVEESPLEPSTRERVAEFQRYLQKHGITVTVRRKLGSDIDASCGQLRRKRERYGVK